MLTRRDFLKYAGVGAAGTAAALALASCAKDDTTGGTTTGTTTGGTTSTGTTTGGTASTEGKVVEQVEVEEQSKLTTEESVTIALNGEPNKLIPDFGFVSNTVTAVTNLMYEPLIAADWPWQLNKNGLTTDWEYIDDTHLRIKLREGVKFTNGDTFNADHVLYMFANGSPALNYDSFKGAECYKEDDYTVVLVAAQPWGQLVDMMTTQNFSVINKNVVEAAGGPQTTELYLLDAGTGKYKFKEWKQGEYIIMERNEDYWDAEHPGYFKEIKFVFLSDSTANGLAAQSGDVDVATGASLANYAVYDADPNVAISFVNSNNVSTLFLNSGNGGVFEDIRVRQAVQCLVDPAALRAVGQFGYGTLCDTIIAPQSPYHDGINESAERQVDVEKAKQLLAEAGYPNGLSVRLRGSGVVAEMIQEQLRQGGIEMEIVTTDTPTHFAALAEGDFDMYVSSQQACYYSEAMRCCDGIGWHYSSLMGGCGFKDEEWHELTMEVLGCTDSTKLPDLMKEYQAKFREKVVSVPLYTGCAICVTRPDIQGINLIGLGVLDFTKMYSTEV